MKNKINAKQTTINTLIALKRDIYARAAQRAVELTQTERDLRARGLKLMAVQKRADSEAAKIAFAINTVRVRA